MWKARQNRSVIPAKMFFFFSSGVIYLFGIRKTNLIQKFIYQIDCQEIFYEIFCIDTVLKIYKIGNSRRTDAEEAKISG